MSRLVQGLDEIAVPEPSDLDALVAFGDRLYAKMEPADLDDAGVLANVAREHAPEFLALAEAACRAGDPSSGQLLKVAAAALPELRNLVFLDAADVALNCPNLLATHARSLANALADTVERLRADDGLQAYACLEVLTRLGLVVDAGRYRALELLSSISLDDSGDLLERLPRLVGLALEQWREERLVDVLNLLVEHEDSRADALFELGQARLRSALEGDSLDEVLAGLVAAREQFMTVEFMTEARDDATIYRAALDVVVAFAGAATNTSMGITSSVGELTVAAIRRVALSTRSSMGLWALPRRQAEAEWYALAHTLAVATNPLGQPSWLTPAETLTRVLAAYQASRSVTVVSGNGLKIVLEPAVEAAFIRREGLLAHLRDALEANEVPETEVDAAHALLDAVSAAGGSGGGDAVGKAWAAAPALAAELGLYANSPVVDEFAYAVEQTPRAIEWMNRQAEARARAKARGRDPIVDALLEVVLAELDSCEDLIGTVREEFVLLLTEIFRFAADRADIGRESGGKSVHYLFPPTDGHPFTEDYLQRDVYSWLCSSGLRRFARMEERDVAAGRADVTVAQEHRFVIEVKRELSDASRRALMASYGGQAAAYSVAGPRLSMAMVLDLTDHAHGVPALRESVWVDQIPITGGHPRHVVTVVVRGNRPTPRQTMTATG